MFYKIINDLAQVSLSRRITRKHNMKFRQIDHTTSQSQKVLEHVTEAVSLAVFRSNFGALILEHVSEIMVVTYNVSTQQKNK